MNAERSKKPGGRKIWLATLLLVGLIAITVVIIAGKKPPVVEEVKIQATNVETQTVQTQPYAESITLPARLMADKEVCVYSETAGMLVQWQVEEGALVHEGEFIAQMEQDFLQASERKQAATVKVAGTRVSLAEIGVDSAGKDKEKAQLAVDAAQSTFSVADKEYKRAKELLASGSLDRSAFDAKENTRTQAAVALDQVKNQLAQADIGIAQAQANLKLARETLESEKAALAEIQINLGKTRIISPIEGILDEHLVHAGGLASPGTRLGCIYKNDVMRAEVDMPDRQVVFLDQDNAALRRYLSMQAPGADLEIKAKVIIPGLPKLTGGFEEGVTLPATVRRIAAASNSASNTFTVELEVPNPGRALRQGILARAEVELLSYPSALVIPLKAVQVSELGPRVFVAETGPDGRTVARVRDIEPKSINKGQLLITKGLNPGEKLIIAGHRGLVDLAPIRVIRADGQIQEEQGAAKTNAAKTSGAEGSREAS